MLLSAQLGCLPCPAQHILAWSCPVLPLGLGLRGMNHLEGGTCRDIGRETIWLEKVTDTESS